MITRIYKCRQCGFVSRKKFKKLTEVEVSTRCEACGSVAQVTIEAPVVIFKGEGFTRHSA
jgi:predicted nucleic acid-binding Zn ribbon protein